MRARDKKRQQRIRESEETGRRIADFTASDDLFAQEGDYSWGNDTVYKAFFDLSPVPMAITDAEKGSIVDVNGAFVEWSHYSRDELIGYTTEKLGFWNYYTSRHEILDRLMSVDRFNNIEVKLRIGGGEFRNVILSGRFVEVGNRKHFLSAAHDITERTHSEDQISRLSSLKEKLLGTVSLQEKLKLIADATVEIFDADFARVWMIKAGDLCETSCPHAVAEKGREVCRNRTRCLHLIASSGRYTAIDCSHSRVPLGCYKIGRVASGQDTHFITNDVSTDPRVHDHAWATELGLVSFAGYRLLSGEGKPIGVLALFSKKEIAASEEKLLEDLANSTSHVIIAETAHVELRESEESARASEAFLNMLLEAIPIPVYYKDRNGRYIGLNKALETFLGKTRKLMIGKTAFDIHSPDLADIYYAKDTELFANGGAQQYEAQVRNAHDKLCDVVFTKAVFTDSRGAIGGIIGTILDITERKQAEKRIRDLNEDLARNIHELKATNDGLRTFSYSLSHDLKVPLVSIRGFSQRLIQQYAARLDEKGRRYLKAINRSSMQMEKLIADLLVFFKLGNEAIRHTHIKMEDIVQEIFHQLKALHPGRTIRLDIKSLPDAEGDGTMIRNVLANLLDNAVKYSRPRDIAVIEVAGWTEEGRNVYYVKDNGVGFPMEKADKLFKTFQRLHAEEFEGTGLGLAIVKRIIERHGGDVWFEADADRGATFFFSIPRCCRDGSLS